VAGGRQDAAGEGEPIYGAWQRRRTVCYTGLRGSRPSRRFRSGNPNVIDTRGVGKGPLGNGGPGAYLPLLQTAGGGGAKGRRSFQGSISDLTARAVRFLTMSSVTSAQVGQRSCSRAGPWIYHNDGVTPDQGSSTTATLFRPHGPPNGPAGALTGQRRHQLPLQQEGTTTGKRGRRVADSSSTPALSKLAVESSKTAAKVEPPGSNRGHGLQRRRKGAISTSRSPTLPMPSMHAGQWGPVVAASRADANGKRVPGSE